MSKPMSSPTSFAKSSQESSSRDKTFKQSLPESAALLLVESKAPWYAADFMIKTKFKQAVPEYQNQKGLIRKAFTIGPAGFFGGLYVWNSRAELDSFYTEERIEQIRQKRGIRPRLVYYKLQDYYDTGIRLRTNLKNAEEWDGDFVLTVAGTTGSDLTAERKRFALKKQGHYPPGLVTDYFVTEESSGQICELKVWTNKCVAKSAEDHFATVRVYKAPTLIEGRSSM